MKLWHAEILSGPPTELAAALQHIEDNGGSIVGMTAVTGPYPSIVVRYTYKRDARSENEGVTGDGPKKETTE